MMAQMVKNVPAMRENWVCSLGWEDTWRREQLSTPVFLPGEFHGQRSLAGDIQPKGSQSWTWLSDFQFYFQVVLIVKNLPASAGDIRDAGWSLGREDPWRRAWQPTPVFLSGESHGQRSLVGYTVHRAAYSQTQLKQHSTHAFISS